MIKSHLKHVLCAQKCKFSDFYVFQGNVAIYLSYGGQTNIDFVGNLVLFAAVKEFCKSVKN